MGNEATIEREAEKAADGFPAPLSVIERPMVDIHADEFIGEVAAHVAGVLERVLNGFFPVIKAVANAVGEDLRDLAAQGRFEAFVNDVSAERQRQAVLLAPPPDSKIYANL